MNKLKGLVSRMARGVSTAGMRFPFTVLCLVLSAGLLFYLIGLNSPPPLWIEKSVFALSVGALLGVLAQVLAECLGLGSRGKALLYGAALLLTAGYLALLWPMPEIGSAVTVRTFVAVFAIICAVLWAPSFRGGADFNKLALIHFKAFFASVLYSAVLYIGIAAILFAVDSLLFSVDNNSYAYAGVMVGVLFAPLYYLSQLPDFSPGAQDKASSGWQRVYYTRFLEVLICYIAIPLFTAYTLVLLAYIVKIIVTRVWPVGLLGPMILVYSAVGVVLFVLASLPETRIPTLFRRIFPKVWVPIVLMQMISVWIRLESYGITESRYYVALFAVFSLVSAIILSIRPVRANHSIALLAALCALLSILPPVDAFTLSHSSQLGRLEQYLAAEGMLSEGKLTPNPHSSEEARIEVTNILSYLQYRHSLAGIPWLPEGFSSATDMQEVFGFQQTWPNYSKQEHEYFFVYLESEKPLDIAGYDTAVQINAYRYGYKEDPEGRGIATYALTAGDNGYTLTVERTSGFNVAVSLRDAASRTLVTAHLQDYLERLRSTSPGEETLPPEELTFVEAGNEARLKIIFQSISAAVQGPELGADYSAYVLVKMP